MKARKFFAGWNRIALLLSAVVASALLPLVSGAEEPRPLDGIEAGLSAHRQFEAQRRERIGRQIDLSESAKAGFSVDPWTFFDGPAYGEYWYEPPLSPWNLRYEPVVRQPIGHRSVQIGDSRWEYHPVYEADDEPLEAPMDAAIDEATDEIIVEEEFQPSRREEASPPSITLEQRLQRLEELLRREPPRRAVPPRRGSGPREF